MRLRNLIILVLAQCTTGAIAAWAGEDNQAFEKIERGRYLAVVGDCVSCHTAPGGAPFAGGAALETPFGALIGPNITPDVATGLGAWSEEDFRRAMHEGIGKGGTRLYPAMPYPAYTKVTRDDVSAIWAYLRTLEPVRNEVQPNQLRFPFNVRRPATSAWDLINFKPDDLSDADLSDANLSAADLSGARLSANLSGANLVATDLSDARLIGANLSGIGVRRADPIGPDYLAQKGSLIYNRVGIASDEKRREGSATDRQIDYVALVGRV